MRKVLYLVTKDPSQGPQSLLDRGSSPDLVTSAILLQDAVSLSQVPADSVYALADDAASRKITPSVPIVSYEGMLRMIFDADSVVAL